jgi:tripartite-type tricarboxylate transporter receptor subunit TctC
MGPSKNQRDIAMFLPTHRSVSRRALVLSTLALALAGSGLPALAQTPAFPSRPITLLVPFPAGGPTDASARLFARFMADSLGQPVIVDNRAGAAGTVGSAFVARAAADGYTLLWGGTSTLAVAPALYRNLKYDSRSFVPIGMALRGPLMLAGKPSLEAHDLPALLAMARKQALTVGTAGNGSIGHLATAYLKEIAGVQFTHIPYRGGSPAIADALGGQIDLVFDTAPALYPLVKSGKLRAYAVTGDAPYGPLPDLPTVRSVLHQDYEAYSWFGLVAPAGTPAPVVERLAAAMQQAASTREVRKELADMGVEAGVPGMAQFAQVIAADSKKWADIITRNNVKAED